MAFEGKWAVKAKTSNGEQELRLELLDDGTTLSGHVVSPTFGTLDVSDGKVDGTHGSWVVMLKRPLKMKLKFEADVDGDEMTGSYTAGPMGSGTITATRE